MSSLKLPNFFSFLKSSIEFLDPGWPPVTQTAEVKPQIRGKHWKARGVWCGLNELIHQNPFSLGVRRTSSRCLLLIIIIIIVADASSSELKLHAPCAENPVSLSLAAGAIVPLIIWLKSFFEFFTLSQCISLEPCWSLEVDWTTACDYMTVMMPCLALCIYQSLAMLHFEINQRHTHSGLICRSPMEG